MSDVHTPLPAPFGDTYANAVGALPGANEAWIDGLRQTSRAILGTQGLPSRKWESWKYTSLNDVEKTPFIPANRAADVDVGQVPITFSFLEDAHKIVLVNGTFRSDLSDPPESLGNGVVVKSLSEAFKTNTNDLKSVLGSGEEGECSFISSLNTGFMEDGLFLSVEDGARVDRPIHVVSIGASGAAPGAFHSRFLVELKQGAQATFVESHIGLPGQSYLTNSFSEIVVGSEANLRHYVLIDEDDDASHLGRTSVSVGRSGNYESFTLTLGGRLCRREVLVDLNEEYAEARVDGAYGLTAKEHSDISSVIKHTAPHTTSHQTVKGVLAGQSRGVFQGKVHVARDAQKADGRQLHKALLLNRGPEVDCKPELEIYADDVQCAHGATTGELDEEHMFYLASRGIGEQEARALLIEGFLNDVIYTIDHEVARTRILEMVKSWLALHKPMDGG